MTPDMPVSHVIAYFLILLLALVTLKVFHID